MQEIEQFIYSVIIPIQIVTDATITTRNRTVYTRTIKLYRGIDNVVKLQFKNQDQKKVDMTGKTVTFNLLNDATSSVWLTKPATVVNATTGIYTVSINEVDMLPLDAEYYSYSVSIVDANDVRTLTYTDDNYSARGQIQILAGHYPQFKASTIVGLSNQYTPTPYSPGSTNTTSLVASDSTIPKANKLHTTQFYFSPTGFTGVITVEATLDPVANFLDGNWFDVKTLTFTDQVIPSFTNWTGIYNSTRFKIVPTTGTITKILYRS